jgi:hypothetical protein
VTIGQVGTGTQGGLFFEEPEVARFEIVAESVGGFTIPDPASHINDRHIEGVFMPGFLSGSHPVILFHTSHTGRPTFGVQLNQRPVAQHTLEDASHHSWHEIIPSTALPSAGPNELTFFVSGGGSVTFSNVILLYKSNQLTVKKPLVFTQG